MADLQTEEYLGKETLGEDALGEQRFTPTDTSIGQEGMIYHIPTTQFAPPAEADNSIGQEGAINHAPTTAEPQLKTQNSKLKTQRLVALLIVITVIAGAAYFLLPSGGDDTVVALVNGEQIKQSDVDVRVNLTMALNEAFKQGNIKVSPDDVLSSLVLQKLEMQDVAKHKYPVVNDVDIENYVNATLPLGKGNSEDINASLTKYGLARSVFTESVRTKLTISKYTNEMVAGLDATPDQRDLKINNWMAGLYDNRTAQISYPNKLRSDDGPAAKLNRQAPELAGVDLNSGQKISLSSLKGKPVLVNFWATWCGPCRDEMPAIVDAYGKYRDKGLVVLAISTEKNDAKDKVAQFIKDYRMSNFPVILDGDDNPNSLSYYVQATPSSYFIDRDGVIRFIRYGTMSGDMLDTNLRVITQ